jgi:hypothetical protein
VKDNEQYWFNQLDRERYMEAIAWFQDYENPPEILFDRVDSDRSLPKSKWEPALMILEKWLDREAIVRYFLGFLLDSNWPGYYFAWCSLVTRGECIIPLLEDEIVKAAEVSDTEAVEIFEDLKEDIEEFVLLQGGNSDPTRFLLLFERCSPLAALAAEWFSNNIDVAYKTWGECSDNWYQMIYELHRLRDEALSTRNGAVSPGGDRDLVDQCDSILNGLATRKVCSTSNDPMYWLIMLSIDFDADYSSITDEACNWFIENVDCCGWPGNDSHWQVLLTYLEERLSMESIPDKTVNMVKELQSCIDAWFEQEMKEHRHDAEYHFNGLFEAHTRPAAMAFFKELDRPHPLIFDLLQEDIDAHRASPYQKWQTGLELLEKWCGEYPEYYLAMLERMYFPATAFAWEVLTQLGPSVYDLVEQQIHYCLDLLPELENAEKEARKCESEMISAYNGQLYNPRIFEFYSRAWEMRTYLEKLQHLKREIRYLEEPVHDESMRYLLDLLPMRSEAAWIEAVTAVTRRFDEIEWADGDDRWSTLNNSLDDGFRLAGSYRKGVKVTGGNEQLKGVLTDLRNLVLPRCNSEQGK